MRGISTILCGAAMGLAFSAGAHGTTLIIDLGDDDEVENINYMVFDNQQVTDAVDLDGNATGISMNLASPTGFNEIGPNWNAGTQNPAGPVADYFDVGMTEDSLFGHSGPFLGVDARPFAEFEIAGLDKDVTYNFTMYAGRADGNLANSRETLYTLSGASSVNALLEVTSNDDRVAQLSVMPDADGKLVLRVEAGPGNNVSNGYYYLGAMAIEYAAIPEPASLALLGLGGCVALLRRR
ncbi:hypothetical protein KS4_07330 [Poriferisphaera corsica]|uniref:Ice-binding protein C-terminal domain-containing protein n=1 Tax=Poriferisphaera corsica TaxID=2528020 RepID=A0A517YR49_9BACT|nr:PEP-CTERM sorting domain-containing protein [Poriferisphaera corsica]QDU32699.1 hypothetical protein KS4_07330 [Poriferisphaera corsica]